MYNVPAIFALIRRDELSATPSEVAINDTELAPARS